jgi:hypothetical protein
LIPQARRPKLYCPHPVMPMEEIRARTQAVWDRYYSFKFIWKRAHFLKSLKGKLAFILISKVYRQMYANTGIASDSARVNWSAGWARWLTKPCRRLFAGRPMPDLAVPPAGAGYSRTSDERLGQPLISIQAGARPKMESAPIVRRPASAPPSADLG